MQEFIETQYNSKTGLPSDIEVTHVAIDEDGNEVKITTLPDGTIQDAEFSDDSEGN